MEWKEVISGIKLRDGQSRLRLIANGRVQSFCFSFKRLQGYPTDAKLPHPLVLLVKCRGVGWLWIRKLRCQAAVLLLQIVEAGQGIATLVPGPVSCFGGFTELCFPCTDLTLRGNELL